MAHTSLLSTVSTSGVCLKRQEAPLRDVCFSVLGGAWPLGHRIFVAGTWGSTSKSLAKNRAKTKTLDKTWQPSCGHGQCLVDRASAVYLRSAQRFHCEPDEGSSPGPIDLARRSFLAGSVKMVTCLCLPKSPAVNFTPKSYMSGVQNPSVMLF